MKAFLRLLGMAPRRRLVGLLLCMVLVSLTDGVGLLLIVPMLGLLSAQQSANPVVETMTAFFDRTGLPLTITSILMVFAGLIIFRSLAEFAQERANTRLQHGIVDHLRLRCFDALLSVEWRWLSSTRRSDHANLLLGDINRVGTGLHAGIGLTVSLVTISTYLGVALLLSVSMTAVACISGGAVFMLFARDRHHALNLGLSQIKASRALHNNVQESLSGIRLAKILGRESRFLSMFRTTMEDFRAQQMAFVERSGLSRAAFRIVGAVLLVVYVYVGLSLLQVPIAEVLILVVIFGRLVAMLMAAQQQFHQWLHALPALDEAERLLDECRAHAEPDDGAEPALQPWSVQQGIALSDISLSYDGRDVPALHDVTLRFPARSTTAIMGESGSGKSTLADILMGLLPPDSGTLTVDGGLVTGPVRRRWRDAVAYVPQDSFLFHDSIRANLLWGNPLASDEALHAALAKASAQFALSLPQGLDTIVGDGGTRLSGGERQRIALARALLRQPALLILDEATSALDLVNEARVREAVEHLHGDLTVVIIGHRLAMLEHADQVVVMHAGRVAAQGAWADVRAALHDPALLADPRPDGSIDA